MDELNASMAPQDLASSVGSEALVLPAELTIYTVGELHPVWSQWAKASVTQEAGEIAQIEAQMVAEVDAAGLQLLLSLERALSAGGRKLCISGTSNALSAACSGLGLSEWLQAHSVEAPL